MHIYLKNIPAKSHLDPIWNYGALGFFEEYLPNKNNDNKLSNDMGSVPDQKTRTNNSLFVTAVK